MMKGRKNEQMVSCPLKLQLLQLFGSAIEEEVKVIGEYD